MLKGAKDHGFDIGGFTAYVTSDVLIGAGLSSSAAFETVVGTIISQLYNDGKMDASRFARFNKARYSYVTTISGNHICRPEKYDI